MENYLIVLFENKVRKKILKKYITFKKAKQFFDKCLADNDNVIFKKNISSGSEIDFEIGLVELSSKQLVPVYITDEMGRNVKVSLENDGMTLIKISKYNVEEYLFDLQTNSKINTTEFIKKYLKTDNVKLVSTLHNKIVIQNEEKISLFSLKNPSESNRFLDCISSYFFKIKRGDCIFVKDVSSAQKKYLINLLSNAGYDKKMLYRKFTTYSPSK
jgi:hypothetical protein